MSELTEQEIIAGNIVVAEYDGWKLSNDYDMPCFIKDGRKVINTPINICTQFDYHSNMNSLWEVLEKCKNDKELNCWINGNFIPDVWDEELEENVEPKERCLHKAKIDALTYIFTKPLYKVPTKLDIFNALVEFLTEFKKWKEKDENK